MSTLSKLLLVTGSILLGVYGLSYVYNSLSKQTAALAQAATNTMTVKVADQLALAGTVPPATPVDTTQVTSNSTAIVTAAGTKEVISLPNNEPIGTTGPR